MTVPTSVLLLTAGLFIGILSGVLGIGGGVLVIPVLTAVLGFTQARAVGTSLAMLLPPIGFFAVREYYRQGLVNVPVAAVLAVTFAAGAWVGGRLAATGRVPESALRTLFGLFLLYVAGTTLFRADVRVWAATKTIAMVAGAALAMIAARAMGKRWERTVDAPTVYRTTVARRVPIDYEI